jgi:hypothetical protein
MSEHKRAIVTIGQADLRRFEETSPRLQSVEDDFQEIKVKIAHSQHELQQVSLQELQERQRFFTHNIHNLDDHLQAIENRTAQAIMANTARLNAHISDSGDSVWQDTSHLLQQQFEAIRTVMDENTALQNEEFARISQVISNLNHKDRQKQRAAQQALNAAQTILDSVAAAYDHERLLPGALPLYASDLELAYQNLENGFFEACLLTSQQVYTHTSAARLEMENILLQERIAYNTTLTRALHILEEYDLTHKVPAIDLQGDELEFFLDVDYWSWGAWHDQRRSCNRILTRMQRQQYELDLTEISRIHNMLLAIEKKLPEIISLARTNILAAQICFNLAECLVMALGEQGFELLSARYYDNDQRQPYLTWFKNLEGSEINVQITPAPKNPLRHSIDLFSNDPHIRTEHEQRQRFKTLRNALEAYGLEVSAFRSQPGTTALPQEKPPLRQPQQTKQPVLLQH